MSTEQPLPPRHVARPDQCHFAGDDHVVLAIGRDYADVAPIDGVICASGGQRLEVSVSVTPVG